MFSDITVSSETLEYAIIRYVKKIKATCISPSTSVTGSTSEESQLENSWPFDLSDDSPYHLDTSRLAWDNPECSHVHNCLNALEEKGER